MAKEYVEREALLYEFDKCEPTNWTGSEAENQADLDHGLYRGLVATAPAADVAEVRHGEWLQNPHYKRIYHCSECGRHIEDGSNNPLEFFPYCHCGAKMDGKGE